jgi:pyruvate dehydrogenase E2 component (dihydrolipoamide acetyltransferase)
MPSTLTMPKLSPTMAEGTLVKWHKKVGDHIEAGDLILEIATDKATVEHNALDEGWLRQILVQEGQEAYVNQAIAILSEEKEESIEGYQPEGVDVAAMKAAKETPSEPPVSEPESPSSETTQATKQRSGLFQPAFEPEPSLKDYEFEFPTEAIHKRIFVSPLARRLAREKNLDLTTVKGTGPNGRIMSRDLEHAQSLGTVAFGRREMPQIVPGTYEEEALSPMRKAIAQRLQESKTFIPHFYISQTVNAEALVEMREQLNGLGIKATYNDFVVRACALALRRHPQINSGFNSVKNAILRFKTIDICVAVSLPSGLITPIVRHADFKNLGELSVEIRALAKRAKEGKLAISEYKGGSFTISNLGMHGTTDFQAVINPPQAAILAVGAILDLPVVRNHAVVPGKILSLTLSVDHRVIDGVEAAEFLKTLKNNLEHPAALIL